LEKIDTHFCAREAVRPWKPDVKAWLTSEFSQISSFRVCRPAASATPILAVRHDFAEYAHCLVGPSSPRAKAIGIKATKESAGFEIRTGQSIVCRVLSFEIRQ
jgi:hypothetical protein